MTILLFTIASIFVSPQSYSIDFVCTIPKKVKIVNLKKYEGM